MRTKRGLQKATLCRGAMGSPGVDGEGHLGGYNEYPAVEVIDLSRVVARLLEVWWEDC